ncbi:MAG: hypothetical protein ABH828_05985 [archaeon]
MIQAYIFELAFVVFLVLGIIFTLILNSVVLQGIVIFLFGVISATLQRLRKTDLNFPYVIIVAAFVIGFLIAAGSGHRFLLFILFILGLFGGSFLKKIIRKEFGKTRK